MGQTKVYSYLRFSDAKQASGHSVERQTEYAQRWAENHGMELDTSLSLRDEGLSAYHQQHVKSGALGTFLLAVNSGHIDPGSILIVEGLDRLSRAEPIQAQAQLAQIINAGITVVTASDGREYNREGLKAQPMDLVYSLLVMIRAHEESDTKSKRVKASIRKLCERWQDGSYRGIIRNGTDPSWVVWTGKRFELDEKRAEWMRTALNLWLEGHGFTSMIRKMKRDGADLTGVPRTSVTLYRAIRNPAIIGNRILAVDGQEFELQGYYPPLITIEQWNELQTAIVSRHRAKGKSAITSIITGLGIATCGYCGHALMAQNVMNRKKKADGTPHNGHRRLICTGGPIRCDAHYSCSVVPIERALLTYCSDQINLDRLTTTDNEAARQANAQLATIRKKIADTEKKTEKLTEAMLLDDADAPAIFVRKIRDLEATLAGLRKEEEAALASASDLAKPSPSSASAWRDLAKAALALDEDARMQVRKLMADTFEKIAIFTAGIIPGEAWSSPIDLVVVARGGKPRLIRIHRRSGAVLGQEDFDLP